MQSLNFQTKWKTCLKQHQKFPRGCKIKQGYSSNIGSRKIYFCLICKKGHKKGKKKRERKVDMCHKNDVTMSTCPGLRLILGHNNKLRVLWPASQLWTLAVSITYCYLLLSWKKEEYSNYFSYNDESSLLLPQNLISCSFFFPQLYWDIRHIILYKVKVCSVMICYTSDCKIVTTIRRVNTSIRSHSYLPRVWVGRGWENVCIFPCRYALSLSHFY